MGHISQPAEADKERKRALALIDERLDLESFPHILEVADDASAAHKRIDWRRVGLIGVGAGALLAAGGFVAAPLIGTALGGAAGLGGAAATAHGLALLGGGALAAGGAGVAGGMWMVAGAFGAAGVVAGGGGITLYQLGAATAARELVKLQVTFKLAILEGEANMIKAQAVLTDLRKELVSTEKALDKARLFSEKNSGRIKDLESTLASIKEAISWMEKEKALVEAPTA